MNITNVMKTKLRLGKPDQRGLASDDERLNYPSTVAVVEPNHQTVDFLKTTAAEMVAEIGIYQGHTSREIAKHLDGRGELHLYDFYDTAERVQSDLATAGFTNVRAFPNSYKYLDSYCWSLAKTMEENDHAIYDYILIDGAHTFAIDGFATVLCDRLLKVGGHLDFDDYAWTLATSPSLRPEKFELTDRMYSREQIDTQQVRMLIDLLVRRDGRYEEVVKDKIFKKIRD